MDYSVRIIRSRRKTIGLQIKEQGIVTVRVPAFASENDIAKALKANEKWIQFNLKKAEERAKYAKPRFSAVEINEMAEKAVKIIPDKVRHYAELMGVTYGRVTIRNQKTRWGSCSSKGNLNFNCLLMCAPEKVLDYVIIHELCHRMEMNHSKRFWLLVEKYMPSYREQVRWLREQGTELIERMIGE